MDDVEVEVLSEVLVLPDELLLSLRQASMRTGTEVAPNKRFRMNFALVCSMAVCFFIVTGRESVGLLR